jgi:hypothetical protein
MNAGSSAAVSVNPRPWMMGLEMEPAGVEERKWGRRKGSFS